jgi:hypothetical protein
VTLQRRVQHGQRNNTLPSWSDRRSSPGGHQPAIKRFVHENLAVLNRLPSAFFQVSASAGSGSPHARMAAQRIMEEFLAHEAWTPLLSASLAGAINYTRYNLLLRWYMKKASEKNGGSTGYVAGPRVHRLGAGRTICRNVRTPAQTSKAREPGASAERLRGQPAGRSPRSLNCTPHPPASCRRGRRPDND